MNPKQRLAAVSRGEKPDRIPFMPTVLEHSAAILGRTPSETAVDASLLEAAHIAAYGKYGQDALTIGIDIYNIEAEALGCEVKFHGDNSIPGIVSHPLADAFNLEGISFAVEKGRIGRLLDAAEGVNNRLGSEVGVGVAICGPFSIAVELYGYENLITDCINDEPKVKELLDRVLAFQKSYCSEIINRNLGITLFESWATPPLVSPGIYSEYVAPYEKELIGHMKGKGLKATPLVIGGDTAMILDDMLETGTTLLVADYKADMGRYLKKAADRKLLLRGNIDPKLVESGPVEDIAGHAKKILKKSEGYPRFVLGTGVIPYGTPPQNILAIKHYLEQNAT